MKSTPTPAINKVVHHSCDAGDLVDAYALAEDQHSTMVVLIEQIIKELRVATQNLDNSELTHCIFYSVDKLIHLAEQTATRNACSAKEDMGKFETELGAAQAMVVVDNQVNVIQLDDITEAISHIGYAANHFNELESLFSSIKNMVDMGEYVHVSHLAEIGKQQAFDKFIFFEEQENAFKHKLQIFQKDVA